MKYSLGYVAFVLLLLGGCSSSSVQQPQQPPQQPQTPPNEPDPQKAAEVNMQLGVEYIKRGQYDIALTRLTRSLEINPDLPETHNAMGILSERLGRIDDARKYYEQAISLKADDSNIQNNYAQFLCKQGEWDQAEVHFLKAAENPLYRTPEIPYTNAGICAARNKSYVRAENYLRNALKINPNLPLALYQMASLNYDIRNMVAARDYLKRYLNTAKHTPQTLWLGIRIERVLRDKNAEASYALLLRSQFPDSEEAQWLKQSEHS